MFKQLTFASSENETDCDEVESVSSFSNSLIEFSDKDRIGVQYSDESIGLLFIDIPYYSIKRLFHNFSTSKLLTFSWMSMRPIFGTSSLRYLINAASGSSVSKSEVLFFILAYFRETVRKVYVNNLKQLCILN